jgi:alpha-D-xyloside xylohydrolase
MSLPVTPRFITEVQAGVWRITLGAPEPITPERTRRYAPAAGALAALPRVAECPVAIEGTGSTRGLVIRIPLEPDELIYGLGLQLQSFELRGTKKRLRVNADPANDTGDSHAPVPFYVTTRGYGVFVDTARYATFYLGNKARVPAGGRPTPAASARHDGWNGLPPYEQKGIGLASEVIIEVPHAPGVDVYVFAGPSLREAVQRYNLFAGGGVLPPRWGLGFWYRAGTDATQDEVRQLAADLRSRHLPCDVLGLEPHWHRHAYSSSFIWSDRFRTPAAMLRELGDAHFRVNLWEQPFVHPASPMYPELLAHAGDHEVWGGLVPDFLTADARRIFAAYHAEALIALGVAGFKADECDNSDFTGNWSFPECACFPSGADGEQMHSLLGLRYQDALQEAFAMQRQRTYGLVRSSGSLAAPSPYVLYSDLYHHGQFVRAVAQTSFSGLLWTPEVRDASSPFDLVRRLQAVVFSPLAMINAWYLKHPPWQQVDRAANHAGTFAPEWEKTEALCRSMLALRMQFVPYLHAAFVRYHREGLPAFRALLMDFPDDPVVSTIADEYLVGDSLLVAPIIVDERAQPGPAGEATRSVYLPAGEWYDFWTGEKLPGRRHLDVTVPIERIPLFVKSGAVLPLAQPTLHTKDPASWHLTVRVFGDGAAGAQLYEDDGSFSPALSEVQLEWDAETRTGRVRRDTPPAPSTPHYHVAEWKSGR